MLRPMSDLDFEAAVVGAGAVGLACGYALARRGLSVLVIDSEAYIGSGVSSRNSEVIHGGLYYATGSLKARLCVQGRRALYAFLDTHGVEYDRCGKLVVATASEETAALDVIERQAGVNDVEGIRRLTGAEARALEPEVNAVEALLSPESGIFDSHGYMLALQGEIETAGGVVALNTPFEGASLLPGGGFELRTGGAEPAKLSVGRLVIAAGLQAQACAELVEPYPAERIPPLHYGKGNYFVLNAKAPFSRLVYPPPITGALGCTTSATLPGAPTSALISSSSRRRTTPCPRRGRRASTPTSASSGRACRTAPSRPTTPASGPSCTAPASPSRTSSSTAPPSMAWRAWSPCSASRVPASPPRWP
jgi:L-2-hydroxyglutarate oxidase LhgO